MIDSAGRILTPGTFGNVRRRFGCYDLVGRAPGSQRVDASDAAPTAT